MSTEKPDKVYLEFAIAIRNARDSKGLTQKEFANIFGISESYLQMLENCRKPPSVSLRMKIEKWIDDEKCNARRRKATVIRGESAIATDGFCSISTNQSGEEGKGGDAVHEGTLKLSEREKRLVERMRLYGSVALWARIEAELDEQEKKFK